MSIASVNSSEGAPFLLQYAITKRSHSLAALRQFPASTYATLTTGVPTVQVDRR